MKKSRVALWLFAVALIVALDQAAKAWSGQVLRGQSPQPELWGLLRFTYVENRGAAFSFLQNADARWFFVAGTVLVLAGIAWALLSRRVTHPLGVWSLAAVTGGAVGNFLDRLFRGYVTDLFQTLFMDFPVFNVADIFLVCGGIALCLYILLYYSKEPGGKRP